jgi:hypothetical protein
MGSHSIRAALAALGLASGAAFGCSGNSDAVDNTPLEPTRDTRISSLAQSACDAYKGCKGYAAGNTYATESDCKNEFEGRARSLWSEDACGKGQIDNDRYNSCVESAKTVACSDNVLSALMALTDCNADKVCSDPPQ